MGGQFIAKLLICFLLLSFSQRIEAQQKLVDLYVTVENIDGQLITGLNSNNFRLFENGKSREIKLFSQQNEPASIGLLFDLSYSMTHNERDSKINRVEWCRQAVLDFLQNRMDGDGYLLLSFGERVVFLSEFMNKAEVTKAIGQDTNFSNPKKKNTALYDAMAVTIQKLSSAKNERRVLIVLSDGEDNRSAQRFKEVEALVKKNKIAVYALAAYDPTIGVSSVIFRSSPGIAAIADVSGGGFFGTEKRAEARQFVARLASILRNQFHIGFVSENHDAPDKWRKLEVKLEISKPEIKLIGPTKLKYRKGYFPFSEFALTK